MHEIAIIEGAIEIILANAKDNDIRRINMITVRVGELSGVLPEALSFAFQCISTGTIAEGAQFQIDRVKATAKCLTCDIVFEIDHFNKLCPKCKLFCNNVLFRLIRMERAI